MISWRVETEIEFQPALQQCSVDTEQPKENFTQILNFEIKKIGPGVQVHTSATGDNG